MTACALGAVICAFEPTLPGGLTAAGTALGSSACDSLEVVMWSNGKRNSLIPHRTLTHWAPLWLVCAWLSHSLPAPWSYLVLGLAVSCLLHIVVDAGSPMGVPLLDPVHRHSLRVPLYRTGTASEIPVILAVFALAGAVIFVRFW